LVLKDIHSLGEHDNIPIKLIPSTFSEENTFLDTDNLLILKPHYMKCYVQLCKELLDHLEDLMTQDSLVGSTVSTRSRKQGSVVSRMSPASVKSVITQTSKASEINKPKETTKTSEYYSPLDFYPTNLNHAFIPKPDFEGYRQEAKKLYEADQDSPSLLNEDIHHMPDNPSTFMSRIREKAIGKVAVHDERCQILNPRVIWDRSIDRFEIFRNNVEGHYGQSGAGYLFDPDFQASYLERGTDCFVDFLNEVPSASQIKKGDTRALYGALLSACQGGVSCRILMENRLKQDGIRSWYQLVNPYEAESNRNVRIKRLENVITTVYHRHYRGGLFKWIQDYEDAFTELVLLGEKI
jgi:hypothetical protein